jgi:hypothetical protein
MQQDNYPCMGRISKYQTQACIEELCQKKILVGHVDVGWFGGNAANESIVAKSAQRSACLSLSVLSQFVITCQIKSWQKIISCNSSEIDQLAATTSIAITNSENEVLRHTSIA